MPENSDDQKHLGAANPVSAFEITQRLEEEVTERFIEPPAPPPSDFGPVTEVLPNAPRRLRVSLSDGELVADRFRIEGGPIGAPTGEAEVFRCVDTRTGDLAALKYYREHLAPKTSVLDSLINVFHPNVVMLRAYGTWAGRFFEVMDYCSGGCLIDHAPYDESELESFLADVATGLQYLHAQGIIHRDIKPTNLYFRDEQNRVVVIGDFGVSSLLEEDEKVRKTATASFFTLDYAAPELIDGKEVSPKTDYYALGITLIHFASGSSPFAGMDKNAVLGCHFRGNVPRPGRLSARFRQLIDGLIRVSPEARWGHGQVMNWLKKKPVMTDDGLPDREEAYAGKKFPYRSLPVITTPHEMALRLNDFDVERDLQRGFVSQWLMFFDTELGKRVAQIEEQFERNPELGVLKLRHLLDPDRAFQVGDHDVRSVAELVNVLADASKIHQRHLQNLLYSESIEAWISTLQPADRAAELAAKIAALRKRVTNKVLGIFALLYVLDPGRPLELTRRVALALPDQLEPILANAPDLAPRVTHLLFEGELAEWLRACFPARAADADFVAACAERYKDNRELGLFAVRCRFQPSLPFKIGLESAATPKELAAIIDRNEETWERGIRALANRWIRTWLTATGQMKDTEAFDEVVNDFTISWGRKMESVLHMLDPALPWPVPTADTEAIEAGAISKEATRTYRICIFNAGRGYLSGAITLAGIERGVFMSAKEIRGEPIEVTLSIEGHDLPVGSRHDIAIIADTNAGRIEIPVSFRITAPLKGMLFRSVLAGILAGELLGTFRLAMLRFLPDYEFTVMRGFSWEYIVNNLDKWAFIPAAAILLGGIGAAVYYCVLFYRFHGFHISEEPMGFMPPPKHDAHDVEEPFL